MRATGRRSWFRRPVVALYYTSAMPANRVRVVWDGPIIEGTGLSTFYFDSAVGTAAQQVAAVAAFLAATDDQRFIGMTWATEPDVATLNVGTGVLEAVTSTSQSSGTGTEAGDGLPPATQGLLRMTTSTIAGGSLLRGRLFLPGATEADNLSGGSPEPSYRADYDAAAAALIADANTAWSVWSKTHGVLSTVVTATVWTKWATLRSRRD